MTTEKIYEKWKPIINIIGEEKSFKEKNFMTEYAEHHSQYIDAMANIEDGDLLPISLKILSQLNLEDKETYIITPSVSGDDFETLSTSILIDEIQYKDVREKTGLDIIENLESVLIEENVKILNEILKNKDNFGVHLMVSELKIEKEEDGIYLKIHNLIKI